MERRRENIELQSLWVELLTHLAANPLGALEVVDTGAVEVLLSNLSDFHSNLAFVQLAVKMLQMLAKEPTHAKLIADNGAASSIVIVLQTHGDNHEVRPSNLSFHLFVYLAYSC